MARNRVTVRVSNRDDAVLVDSLCNWFAANARDLPWRAVTPAGRRDPYRSLVSEVMLQQTQVSRVLEKFAAFIEKFPTVRALAAAPLDDVLAAWSGLGYYRRARLLHAAAKAVVERFAGDLPTTAEELRTLPGIGRYTAGALASIVHGLHEPIVDGNVARVLLRVRGQRLDQKRGMDWAWGEAERLVGVAAVDRRVAAFNEGLMELGALICTPMSPRCLWCPLQDQCEAFRLGVQEDIPAPKAKAVQKRVVFSCIIVRDEAGRVLLEKRGETGLWAGMWQPPTLETTGKPPTAKVLAAWLGVRHVSKRIAFVHHTTHREVDFRVFEVDVASGGLGRAGSWFEPGLLASLALSNAHRKILEEASR